MTKKMTKGDDARLHGRHPEFPRMSRGGRGGKGGIGAPAMAHLADVMLAYEDAREVDVAGYMIGAKGKKIPLGTYLRRKFRELVGTPEGVIEHADYKAWLEQMLPLHALARETKEAVSLRQAIIAESVETDRKLKFREELYLSTRKGRI